MKANLTITFDTIDELFATIIAIKQVEAQRMAPQTIQEPSQEGQ